MNCILSLDTNRLEVLNLNLQESIQSILLNNNKNVNVVYSDFDYVIGMHFDKDIDIERIKVFINDKPLDVSYINGNVYFNDISSKSKKIFMNYFGYVIFYIQIYSKDGQKHEYYSDYLDVAIRNDISSEIVREMVRYISKNSYEYMFEEETNVKDFSDVSKSNNKNLLTEIAILESILYEYEDCFKFFKKSSKYKLTSNNIIDDFEKLKQVKSETIQYIATNPHFLSVVDFNTGIKLNKYNLQPKKTLINKNDLSYSIYENQVVLGFLKYIYNVICEKMNEIDKRICIPNSSFIISPYISSSGAMHEAVVENLEQHKNKLCAIKVKLQQIYVMYKSIFRCEEIIINRIPKPSHIFLEIQHYRRIYKVIKDWFESGNYNLSNEKMLLTFSTASQIYEYYVLLKINSYIKWNGYDLNSATKYKYILNRNSRYKNTMFKNTFIFKKQKTEISIYYQPVIYLDHQVNDIGLFRNNSISLINEKSYYYTPDFIIKIGKEQKSHYIILDAKWSSLESVINYSFKEIVYKYLFSISTINKEDTIDKVWAVNGKSNDNQQVCIYNFYNSTIIDRCNEILPSAKIMTLNPYIDDNIQKDNLEQLFSMI